MQIEFAQIEFFINTYSCIYYSIYSDILHLYAYASLFPQRSSAQIKYVSKRDKARTVSFQEKSLSTKFFEKKEKKEGKEQLNLYLETKHPDHVEASIKSESGMKGQKKLVAKKKKKCHPRRCPDSLFTHRNGHYSTILFIIRTQFFPPPLVPRFVANSSQRQDLSLFAPDSGLFVLRFVSYRESSSVV